MDHRSLDEKAQTDSPSTSSVNPEPNKATRQAFIIAIANQKGGVAKTTTAAALGGALVLMDYEVLLIDLDAQANLTLALGKDPARVRGSGYRSIFQLRHDHKHQPRILHSWAGYCAFKFRHGTGRAFSPSEEKLRVYTAESGHWSQRFARPDGNRIIDCTFNPIRSDR